MLTAWSLAMFVRDMEYSMFCACKWEVQHIWDHRVSARPLQLHLLSNEWCDVLLYWCEWEYILFSPLFPNQYWRLITSSTLPSDVRLFWSPYGIGQTIIFLLCGFFFLSSFFSSPNLNRCRLDVCHTSTHGVALVRISDAGLKHAAHGSLQIRDAK